MTLKRQRANNLDGRTWTRYSISVWDDVFKSKAEKQLAHPAIFPLALVDRLLKIFTLPGDLVLDPFMGSGSTLLGAFQTGRRGLGLEINNDYLEMFAKRRQEIEKEQDENGDIRVIEDDARNIHLHIGPDSLDLCLTSPPYWNILKARRTADHRVVRNYGDHSQDLGGITDYDTFLHELQKVFSGVYSALKTGKYCVIVVMDIRKKNTFYPLHMDLIRQLLPLGFVLDDIIIWDRREEYHNLRPLGFPHVFRINKVHEFVLIMQKRA